MGDNDERDYEEEAHNAELLRDDPKPHPADCVYCQAGDGWSTHDYTPPNENGLTPYAQSVVDLAARPAWRVVSEAGDVLDGFESQDRAELALAAWEAEHPDMPTGAEDGALHVEDENGNGWILVDRFPADEPTVSVALTQVEWATVVEALHASFDGGAYRLGDKIEQEVS